MRLKLPLNISALALLTLRNCEERQPLPMLKNMADIADTYIDLSSVVNLLAIKPKHSVSRRGPPEIYSWPTIRKEIDNPLYV